MSDFVACGRTDFPEESRDEKDHRQKCVAAKDVADREFVITQSDRSQTSRDFR